MIELNENELIKKFLEAFKIRAESVYGLNLLLKNVRIERPAPTEDFKDFKNGMSSTRTETVFDLNGWKSFSDDGIKKLMLSVIEEDDLFAPVVDIEVFEVVSKGRTTVTAVFSIVYTGYQLSTESKLADDVRKGNVDKDDIIGEIEIRLSEIYSLLKKLKK
jgi:hypothetical protein